MSESTKVVVLSPDELKELISSAVADALKSQTTVAEKDWLKAEEASLLYGLPKSWFEERGRAGEIARAKPGRYTLFARRDIEAYLEQKKEKKLSGSEKKA